MAASEKQELVAYSTFSLLVTWSCPQGPKGHPTAILQVQGWCSKILTFSPAASLKWEGIPPGGGGSRARG